MPSLDQLISSSRRGVERRRDQRPLADLEAAVDRLAPIHPFTEWVGGDEISFVIRMSGHEEPALPPFGNADVSGLAGARELIEALAGDTQLPFLLTDSHDLVIDPYQVYEARVCGAGGVVLLAAALEDDSALAELYDLAVELGLDVVLDVGEEEEIERVLELLDPDSFIIRNRKDGGKEADFERTFSLLEEVPAGQGRAVARRDPRARAGGRAGTGRRRRCDHRPLGAEDRRRGDDSAAPRPPLS